MPKRSSEHMAAQREAILRATLHCISEYGIEGASIAAIRRQAGLSAGALYVHFENKEAIIAAALSFASVTEWRLPDTWPEFVRAIANIADDENFDINLVARTQLQVLATAIRPGPQHELLKPIIQSSLNFIVRHLTIMEESGQIKLRMAPLQTAFALGAVRDGILWMGLALDRSSQEIEADMVAAFYCFIEPVSG